MLEFFQTVLQALLVVIIPLVLGRILRSALQKMVHEEFFQVPILTILARTQGILAGLMLLYLDLDRQYFDVEQIFMPDGPWDLSLPQFFLERANVFMYNSSSILTLLTNVQSSKGLLAGFVVIGLPLASLILSLSFWQRQEAMRALLASAGIALWTGWVTVYVVATFFWILYLLNVWSLILLLIFIKYRSDSRDTESWWPW